MGCGEYVCSYNRCITVCSTTMYVSWRRKKRQLHRKDSDFIQWLEWMTRGTFEQLLEVGIFRHSRLEEARRDEKLREPVGLVSGAASMSCMLYTVPRSSPSRTMICALLLPFYGTPSPLSTFNFLLFTFLSMTFSAYDIIEIMAGCRVGCEEPD